ncbi:MAG TPA: hypothetical protein VFD85_15095 [Gemmatimonadales bacterium]|nr:hypothetical protein [Gemmatimonadales bacterium]
MRIHPMLAMLSFLTACGADQALSVNGITTHTLSVAVGQELDLMLSTVGPGQYSSPPLVSSSAVRFLDDSIVGPFTPGGPTQRFRFQAAVHGQAVVTFTHTGGNPTVQDTVNVQ